MEEPRDAPQNSCAQLCQEAQIGEQPGEAEAELERIPRDQHSGDSEESFFFAIENYPIESDKKTKDQGTPPAPPDEPCPARLGRSIMQPLPHWNKRAPRNSGETDTILTEGKIMLELPPPNFFVKQHISRPQAATPAESKTRASHGRDLDSLDEHIICRLYDQMAADKYPGRFCERTSSGRDFDWLDNHSTSPFDPQAAEDYRPGRPCGGTTVLNQ